MLFPLKTDWTTPSLLPLARQAEILSKRGIFSTSCCTYWIRSSLQSEIIYALILTYRWLKEEKVC